MNQQTFFINVSPDRGTYALLLSSATDAVIQVGRLGSLRLRPGYYVYIGSALGSGGVRARLAHHMRSAERPHWHIDYLRAKTALEGAWVCYDHTSRECQWARRFGLMPGASVPMVGFGSSDCDCESHLFFFRERPGRNNVVRQLPKVPQNSTMSALLYPRPLLRLACSLHRP